MSAFDDEFGLFGDDEAAPEDERKSTLGARQIASSESFNDDIEPEDERPARRRPSAASTGGGDRRPYRDHGPRPAGDPAVAQARAVELLMFLAKRLVSKPDDVIVSVVDGQRGPIIELEVHPEDFGKVIGKGGRVAQALRTIVRASAEGKVTIDIVDVEDDDEHETDLEHSPAPVDAVAEASADEAAVSTNADDDEGDAEPAVATTQLAAKKIAAKKPSARKKSASSAAPKRKKSD